MARRLLVTLVLGLPVLAVTAIAPLAFGAEGEPTISFTSTGTPPLVCGTHPSVTSLSVSNGTKIVVANRTGVAAVVDIGRKRVLDLAPGTGALVKLKPGQHELRLIPDCAVVTATDPVVVSVLTGGQAPDAPSPSGDPDDPVTTTLATPSSTGTAGPAVGGAGVADPGAGGTTAAGPGVDPAAPVAPSGGAPGVAGSARPAAADEPDGSLESAVIDVQPIDLGGPRDPKGVRLLAVIAAICVFGVTAAIIRAIVSQRTSTTVTM